MDKTAQDQAAILILKEALAELEGGSSYVVRLHVEETAPEARLELTRRWVPGGAIGAEPSQRSPPAAGPPGKPMCPACGSDEVVPFNAPHVGAFCARCNADIPASAQLPDPRE